MKNSVFGKTIENVIKHGDIKLVTTEKRRKKNSHKTKWFSENLLAIEMKKKTKVKMNNPVYLGLSILDIRKIVTYEYWYDYLKSNFDYNVKLCYMDTDSFIVHMKTKDADADLPKDVEKRPDTLNYEVNRPLPIGINKKVVRLMKDDLGGRVMIT